MVSLDAIKLCYSVAFKNKSRLFCEQLLLGCIQNNIGWARFLEIKYELRCSTFSFSWRLCFGFLDLAHKYTLLEYWFTIIINILILRKKIELLWISNCIKALHTRAKIFQNTCSHWLGKVDVILLLTNDSSLKMSRSYCECWFSDQIVMG